MRKVSITHERLDGSAFAVYDTNGLGKERLVGLVFDFEELSPQAFKYIMENLKYFYPEDGRVCAQMTITPDIVDSGKLQASEAAKRKRQKIARFCAMYLERFKVQYKVTPTDIKLVEQSDFDEPLLKLYFGSTEWWNKNRWSVSNFVSNENTLKLMQKGVPEFGDKYDPALERALSNNPEKLQHYWAHLRQLGWHTRKAPTQNGMSTIGWERGDEFIPKFKQGSGI